VNLQAKESDSHRAEVWLSESGQRESAGRCLAHLVLAEVASERDPKGREPWMPEAQTLYRYATCEHETLKKTLYKNSKEPKQNPNKIRRNP
jgi:hypothetical protein